MASAPARGAPGALVRRPSPPPRGDLDDLLAYVTGRTGFPVADVRLLLAELNRRGEYILSRDDACPSGFRVVPSGRDRKGAHR